MMRLDDNMMIKFRFAKWNEFVRFNLIAMHANT